MAQVEVVIEQTAQDAGRRAASTIEQLIVAHQRPVIGLATGSSPLPIYQELIRKHATGDVSFANVTAFLLDEYVGLPTDHAEAYRSFIQREFANHVDLPADALFGPDGNDADPSVAATRYEKQILEAGGIDLQLLGIGSDGHIGFNEPTSSLCSRTRLKTLMDETRVDNARFFGDNVNEVPRHVLTQGIGTILDARHLVLIATGANKAKPVREMIEGPVTAMVPASALQLHSHVTIVLDELAAQELSLLSYYREVFANKPPGQHL